MKKLFGLVLLLTVFFWASSVDATIRYVDRDNSCPGSGTTGAPYCNIQNAMDVAVAGDFIRIRDSAGAYTGTINSANSGTSGNPIIIEPDTGHNPTMLVMFNMFAVSYITIRNLRWDACSTSISPMSAIHWEANDTDDVVGIEISGNTINCWGGTNQSSARSNDQGDISLRSNYSSPFSNLTGLVTNNTLTGGLLNAMTIAGSGAPSGATLTVSNNNISGVRCGLSSDGYRYLAGIVTGGGTGSHLNRIQFINNHIHDFQTATACYAAIPSPPVVVSLVGGGFYCDAGHYGDLVDGNLIHGIDWSGVSGARAHGIFWENGCSNAQLSRNVIYDVFSDDGSGIQLAGNSSCGDSHDNKVWNNTVYNTSGFGGFAYWHFARDTDVANNIFVQSSGAAYGVYVEVEAATVCTGNTWRNNTFYKVGGGTINYQWGTTATTSIATWRTLSGDSQALNTDPLFVNAATHDFTLQSSSPAKDSGVNVGLSFNGSAPDRGRYELAAAGGNTYYVRSTAAPGHNCTQAQTDNDANAMQTITAAVNCMSGSGHTVRIHGGTYNERLNEVLGGITFPRGSSWSAGGYNVIEAIAGETVTVLPTSDSNNAIINPTPTSTPYYLWFLGHNHNFILDGAHVTSGQSAIKHEAPQIRYEDMDIGNADGSGFYMSTDSALIINNLIHGARGNPATPPYGIYADHNNHTITGNEIYNNSGPGIQIYGSPAPNNTVFANNRLHDNSKIGGVCNSAPTKNAYGGMTVAGTNHKIYNNLIYNNCGIGLTAYYFTSNTGTVFYGNTIYGSTEIGIDVGQGVTARNNISSGNGGAQMANSSASSVTADHNLCSSACGIGSSNLTGNPLFQDAANADFRLQSGSPAINAGANLGSTYSPDIAGVARPTSGPWDIGAYESLGGTAPTAGNTYWVNSSSSGSHCVNSATDPGTGSSSQTIAQGIACMVAAGGGGHTLKILTGTYNETLNEPTGGLTFPHGTSWLAGGFNTIEAVAGATVTVRPTSPPSHVIDTTFTSTPYYLLFKGNSQNFIFDGVNTTGGASVVKIQAPFIRFSSVEIKNANSGTTTNTGQGVYLGASNIDIWDSNIHNNGPDGSVGVGYSIYGTHDNHTILNNLLHDNSGFAIQLYPAGNNNTFANNKIYNNGKLSSGSCNAYGGGGVGAVLIAGTNHKVYNNVIYNNCGDGLSAFHFSANTGTVFYNNTVYNTTGKGILGNGNTIQNNISFGNGGAAIAPTDVGDTFTADHNYCNSGCTGTGTINSGTNPFQDAANANFQLLSSSSAINAGVALGSPYNVAIDGTARPQPVGGLWDIGAYESGTPPVCPSVPNALVASYGFEGNGNDSAGVNTATLGSGWSYTGSGKYGQGAVSTGASGITVADANALDMCNGFTYEAWVNLPNTSGSYALINKNPNSSSFLFASFNGYCGSGVPIGGYNEGGNVIACYGTPLTTGSFQHLAVTYDATLASANIKVYLNGTQVTTADGTALLTPTTGTLQFCSSSFVETCPSGTVIDEVRIYNYARTGPQIASDMATPVVIPVLTPPTLKLSGIMKFGASASALKLNQQ